jgi:hypothetical protein
MNKKEIRSAINKAAYQYAESLGYEIQDLEGDGSVDFAPPNCTRACDYIQWHRNYQSTCVADNANDKIKADANLIDAHMKPIIEYYNNQYKPKNAKA